MKENYKIICFICCCSIFISCKEKCSGLSREQLAFLVYEKGDNFKLRNEDTGDIEIFQVSDKDIGDVLNYSVFSGGCQQEVSVNFNNNGKESGHIIVKLGDDLTYIFLSLLINSTEIYIDNDVRNFGSLEINGTQYENIYLFNSPNYEIYFSKINGFLKIDDKLTGKTLYTIVD